MAAAIAPALLVGAFFVASTSPASAAQPTITAAKALASTTVETSSFVHEASSGTSGSWATDKVAPGAAPHTYTFEVPAPASECAMIHQQHPGIKIGKTCENTETLTIGTARIVKQSTGVHASTVKPQTTYYTTASTHTCSAIACAVWGNTISTAFYYTGGEVWEDFLDCNDSSGIGYQVSVTWCGNWHNHATSQTGSYMNDGDDFEVSVIAKGIPIDAGHWQRINCNVDGQTWITGSD
ncbi:hypothetical protein [Streptacidiphilus sp. P02-A3a]|uniref:hypothetical protein n=1 Tax=Streptacidiphilus sp. P02-A3a TaxID=2704468 RepID=UPI0015F9824E|nr:hypothetical protein [Streptacidiphilus sp. P02-A3a]QMU73092.1 hypothetical protein GXP74_37490 [Streptacidiphilus sp. P02-A3a]